MIRPKLWLHAVLVCWILAGTAFCQHNHSRKKTITRIFWQDAESHRLDYADLQTTDTWHIRRGSVEGMPQTLSPSERMGPIGQIGTDVVTFVNDTEAGSSKLFRIQSGAFQQPHGNHFHWRYSNKPSIKMATTFPSIVSPPVSTNDNQVFPLESGGFFMATNDANYHYGKEQFSTAANFLNVENQKAFFSINPVDSGSTQLATYQLNGNQPAQLVGTQEFGNRNIRSAMVVGNKLLVAVEDGISWSSMGKPSFQELSGFEQGDKFSTDWTAVANTVLFTESDDKNNALAMINTNFVPPQVSKLKIQSPSGVRLSGLKTKTSLGKNYAFLFLESQSTNKANDQLVVIELDPNRDRNFSDARVKKSLAIGRSSSAEIRGHHQICFDAYGRFAIFTEPLDGMINIMTISDLVVRAKFRVGGRPDKIVAIGAAEHFH